MSGVNSNINRRLKESVNVEEIFCIYLAQLTRSEPELHLPDVWYYKPAQLDEIAQSDLRTKVKVAIDSPQDTTLYKSITQSGVGPKTSEMYALQQVELAGLVALILLGERSRISNLLKFMRKNQDNIRARNIVSGVLFHVTGEDIGSYFLTENDLDLWEQWWEQNKSSYPDD